MKHVYPPPTSANIPDCCCLCAAGYQHLILFPQQNRVLEYHFCASGNNLNVLVSSLRLPQCTCACVHASVTLSRIRTPQTWYHWSFTATSRRRINLCIAAVLYENIMIRFSGISRGISRKPGLASYCAMIYS